MSEVDRITDSDRKAIVDLLNRSLQVEYGILILREFEPVRTM